MENERFEYCLGEFLERYPNPSEGMKVINHIAREVEVRGWRGGWDGAGRFLFRLARRNDDYGVWTCEEVLAQPDSPLRPACCDLLVPLRERDEARARDLARRFAKSDRHELQLIAAAVYWYPEWRSTLNSEDWETLQVLAKSPFLVVRHGLLRALHSIDEGEEPLGDRRRVLDMVMALDIEDNEDVADEMASLFTGYSAMFALDTLADDEVQHLMQKLLPVREIDHHHIQELLTRIAKRWPLVIFNFLLARLDYVVEHGGKTGVGEFYSPVPFDLEQNLPLDLSPLGEHPGYEEALRQICRQSVGMRGRKAFWLPRLFRSVSLDCGPTTLRVIDQWVTEARKDEEVIKAASLLLSSAPPTFLFEQVEFISRMLGVAHSINRDCFHEVGGHFWMSLSGGTYMRSAFEPAQRHVQQRDESRRIALTLPVGSPEREFYEWLAKNAESEIKDELKRDAELADEQ